MPETVLEVPIVPKFDLPEGVELTVTFGSHTVAADLGTPEEFAEALKSTDIFAPEAVGWDASSLASYNKVASGNVSMLRRVVDEGNGGFDQGYGKAVLDGLFWNGRNVKVAFFDVPAGPLAQATISVVNRQTRHLLRWLPFDQAVDGMVSLLKEMSVVNLRREHYILEHLAGNIRTAAASVSRLRNRPAVKVWMLMGAYHLGMGDVIRQRQLEAAAENFSYTERIQPGCENFAIKGFMDAFRAQEDKSFRELAARVIIQNILSAQIPVSDQEHNGLRASGIQDTLQSMSWDDIREFYEQTRKKAKA